MTDLTKLYDDWIAKRLAWQTVRREKEEILLKGIVDEIEALKAGIAGDTAALASVLPKRAPGRPPKVEAA
jgi:glucose-6-phosphate dehydrogenase assembly protein OpcA